MPVFDQGYQHWNGHLSGHASRWLAITRQGVRAHLKNRWTKYLVISAWTPALALGALLGLWGLFEQQSEFIKPFLFLFQGLPEQIREGPTAFRASVWTVLFHFFFNVEVFLAMVLTLLVGPDLISQDLRFNAIPLYFSRPLRRIDYFAGKLGVIAFFLLAVTVVPALLAYLVGVAFSLDISVVRDTWRVLLGSLAFGLILTVVCGLIMLAFSALSRNSRYVAMLWVGLWLVSEMVGGVLSNTINRDQAEKPWAAVSLVGNLKRVREALLDTETARDQIMDATFGALDAARQQIGGGGPGGRRRGGFFGGLFRPRNQPEPPPPPPPPPGFDGPGGFGGPGGPGGPGDARTADGRNIPPFFRWLVSPYPWPLAATVLAVMSLLSMYILTTRVRSLDRPR